MSRPSYKIKPVKKFSDWWIALFLIVATILAYQPVWHAGFIWDDDSWTTEISGLLRDKAGLCSMWLHPAALQQYYPLTGTTFWMDYHLWGFWPLPYHVENVLFHALAAVLFWRLLLRLEVSGAWLAAAIFALHPVMVESVAWITERKNVLSLALFLGAMLAYGTFAQFWKKDEPSSRRWNYYALALALFLAALLAKTTTFALPALILLICWWKRGRIRWQTDMLPILPFFALAVSLCFMTAWLEKNNVGAQGAAFVIPFPGRCLIAGHALCFYIGKLMWPANLCFVYPRWQLDARSPVQWFYAIATIGALLAIWLARTRLGRGTVTAIFFFTGALFPVLGFMNAYGMRYSFVWNHWVYLPSLGIIALAAASVMRLAERLRSKIVAWAFAAVVLSVFALLTWQECKMYADVETLWRMTIDRNPACFLAYNNLGIILYNRGDENQAVDCYKKTLELNPGFEEAYNNLGIILNIHGHVDEAIADYEKALEINPRYAEAHNNLALSLVEEGRMDEAIVQYQKTLETNPDSVVANFNLGNALFKSGRMDEAVAHYQKALANKPGSAEIHFNLGTALMRLGRVDDAIVHFKKAVEINPGLAVAQASLDRALSMTNAPASPSPSSPQQKN